MKKTAAVALFCLMICSCKKDELNSKDLLVYVAGDYAALDNRITVPFIHTPVGVTGNTIIKIPVYATREVPADIDATIAADMPLVAQYNQQNNRNCLPLPAANYKMVNPGKQRIKTGALVSDTLVIEILTPAGLTDPNGYLLPLTIVSIEGKDKGARISTNQRTVYVNVTYEFNNIQATQAPLAGALMSRTGWSVTVSNTTSGALGPAMLDGSNTTAWRSSNSTTAAKYVILSMGSQQTIKGFQIVPNYVSTSENATQMTLSTSADSTTWFVQGIWKGTGPVAGSTAAAPDIKGINFISPVQAKYFRFDITALVSGGRVGIGELNAVQ